jgi:hypothetical protein
MSAAALEALLAQLYGDAPFRKRFLADPRAVALASGLDEDEARRLQQIDREGLELAAESYARKREHRGSD